MIFSGSAIMRVSAFARNRSNEQSRSRGVKEAVAAIQYGEELIFISISQQFSSSLLILQATKKGRAKQREVLKDLITSMMQRIHGKETLQSTGSELAKKDPKVLDIAISTDKR